MEMNADVREEPDVSKNVRRTNLSCKFKLRWMGIEIEAEPMRVVLRSVDPECTLLADPFDTD
jgi:hypothetical protein